MNETKTDLVKRLEKIAYQESKPFCYGCYREAPTGRCIVCGSDDLMRLLPQVGCEYGTDWIVQHLVEENLSAVNLDEAFEESVSQCYPEEVKIGWITYDTVSALKELDPISWDLAKSEWIDQEVGDENIESFDNGSTYYSRSDIECYLDETEGELESTG